MKLRRRRVPTWRRFGDRDGAISVSFRPLADRSKRGCDPRVSVCHLTVRPYARRGRPSATDGPAFSGSRGMIDQVNVRMRVMSRHDELKNYGAGDKGIANTRSTILLNKLGSTQTFEFEVPANFETEIGEELTVIVARGEIAERLIA